MSGKSQIRASYGGQSHHFAGMGRLPLTRNTGGGSMQPKKGNILMH